MKVSGLIAAALLAGTISSSVLADTFTAKVSVLRSDSSDPNTIYFKTDPLPQGVTAWFYFRNQSVASAGCSTGGSEGLLNRSYSMLLTAKSTEKPVHLTYCVNSNGYGLIKHIDLID